MSETASLPSRVDVKGIFEEGYWDINHVASFLDVSPHTVKDWNRNGKMPGAFRFGRCVRWKIADIKKWALAKQENSALNRVHVMSIKNAAVFQTGRINGNE